MSTPLQDLQENGFVNLPPLLSRDRVQEIRSELEPHLGAFGRNPFEGEKTQRIYALLAKAPSVADLVEDPSVLELVDQFLRPTYLLWGALAINLHPGKTRQAYHCDDDAGSPARPRQPRMGPRRESHRRRSPHLSSGHADRIVHGLARNSIPPRRRQ
jgi:hypothetical protein